MQKVLMVVHSYYPSDPRVRREAEALGARGDRVDIVCLREGNEKRCEIINRINIHRLPVNRHRGSGFLVYLLEYITFFSLAFLKTTSLFLQNRYQVIHVHTIPDFLVFCSLVPRFFGSLVLLDMHEVMPEFFSYRYRLSKSHPLYQVVIFMEKISTKFADHIITVSDTLKEILISRNVSADKITIIMNVPDKNIFKLSENQQPKPKDSFVLSYHGLLSDIYDLKIILESLLLLKDKIPNLKFIVIGKGPQEPVYKKITERLGLNDIVSFTGYMPQEKVVSLLKDVDVGIVPLANNEFTQLAFPTKIVEYVIMGIPVITADRETIKRYFHDDALAFYNPDSGLSLVDKVYELSQSMQIRNNLVKNALECYKQISWDKMKERYYELIDEII
jgi:glycosyltransferase involved in cell wall biosynthesis